MGDGTELVEQEDERNDVDAVRILSACVAKVRRAAGSIRSRFLEPLELPAVGGPS
jgi:hypothetical protein